MVSYDLAQLFSEMQAFNIRVTLTFQVHPRPIFLTPFKFTQGQIFVVCLPVCLLAK